MMSRKRTALCAAAALIVGSLAVVGPGRTALAQGTIRATPLVPPDGFGPPNAALAPVPQAPYTQGQYPQTQYPQTQYPQTQYPQTQSPQVQYQQGQSQAPVPQAAPPGQAPTDGFAPPAVPVQRTPLPNLTPPAQSASQGAPAPGPAAAPAPAPDASPPAASGETPATPDSAPVVIQGGWLPRGSASLEVLDKVNARVEDVTVKTGQSTTFETLTIAVRSCMVRPSDQPADATAFVTVTDTAKGQTLFSAWILHAEPAASMMQNPIYGIRLAGCGA